MKSIEMFNSIVQKLIDSEVNRKELSYKNTALNKMNQDLQRDLRLTKITIEESCNHPLKHLTFYNDDTCSCNMCGATEMKR